MIGRIPSLLARVGIALLAFFMPFTSFPLVARLTGSSMVAPLSLLPLAALLLFWLPPFLLRRGAFPPQVKVLTVFVIVALVSSIAAFVLPIPPYQGHSILNRVIEGLMTLTIGVGFYLLLSAWVSSTSRLHFLLRWVNWGGLLMLAWSFLQAVIWYRMGGYPEWLWDLQGRLSTSLMLFPQRVNGFAYEPSWFAHQLNMLYLPYWLAATVTGFTAHRLSLGKLHFENILLVGGLAALFLSVSRIGWLAFLLMLSYMLLYLTWRFIKWAQNKLLRRFGGSGRWEPVIQHWFVIIALLVLLIFYAALMFGAAYALSRYDPRMARLFDLSALTENSIFFYANQLVFAERIVFWQAGWETFNDFPILGVGLGNAGFFFQDKLSDFSWGLTETRLLAYQWTSLPNIKSLWVRLLAETGIVGFAVFTGWWYVLWKSGRFLLAHQARLYKMMGLAGALVLIGLIIEGFSVDTFALPYYWFALGLLTAACELARRSQMNPPADSSLE